mmetsp:Transcript_6100/g.23070  ORF Transcript_6100/g.23070 Transcript_6100/m.23070 type:complete len:209 (-) Transcript_6100:1146-1772(-)
MQRAINNSARRGAKSLLIPSRIRALAAVLATAVATVAEAAAAAAAAVAAAGAAAAAERPLEALSAHGSQTSSHGGRNGTGRRNRCWQRQHASGREPKSMQNLKPRRPQRHRPPQPLRAAPTCQRPGAEEHAAPRPRRSTPRLRLLGEPHQAQWARTAGAWRCPSTSGRRRRGAGDGPQQQPLTRAAATHRRLKAPRPRSPKRRPRFCG